MAAQADIESHGLIGDLQTAALVAIDGSIDWYCCPRFDSPSVFASLLDADKGGFFRIGPVGDDVRVKQLYLPGTAVLVTRFITPTGVGELFDLMPPRPGAATDRHDLVRGVRVTRGHVRFVLECQPRFDYGRAKHEVALVPGGARFENHVVQLALLADPAAVEAGETAFERRGEGVVASFELDQGQARGFVLRSAPGAPADRLAPGEALGQLGETVTFWQGWLRRGTFPGRWREPVERSAITLKLMTYAPTGALVAAPTASLPEQEGGERNWDYRYTWVRDSSFSVSTLLKLGFTEEANAFGHWLGARVAEQVGTSSGPLRIMYRVDGSSDLSEELLGHLDGWHGSRPVRIGNGAADQLQLDIYGEAMDALYEFGSRFGFPDRGWRRLSDLVDWLCDHWDQPEEGIWETRGGRKDFVYGRFQVWLALDRALRLASQSGRPARTARWTDQRDQVYEQIFARGWSAGRGAFVQHYGSDVLDASLLLMPLVGFVSPEDPQWLSTLDAMGKELVSDSLVYRYDPEASPDGLRGAEGTFSMCSFWYVDALARSGRLDEARMVFEKMLTYGNHLGLFSEEIGISGQQLGNFPQAFSHLALVQAAVTLDRMMDGR